MNRTVLAIVATIVAIVALSQSRGGGGDTIRIYAADERLQSIIAELNTQLSQFDNAVKIETADTESAADVSVSTVERFPERDALAKAYTFQGRIKMCEDAVNSYEAPMILLHELLHCAGVAHNETPHSVMNAKSTAFAQVSDEQIEQLRKLAGITFAGRIAATATAATDVEKEEDHEE